MNFCFITVIELILKVLRASKRIQQIWNFMSDIKQRVRNKTGPFILLLIIFIEFIVRIKKATTNTILSLPQTDYRLYTREEFKREETNEAIKN